MHKNIYVAHLADVHLRDRQFNRASRGADFTAAFEYAVDESIKIGVSAILLAGDLFDTNRPSSQLVMEVVPRIHTKLVKAGVPMFTVLGDHDYTNPPWSKQLTGYPDRGIVMLSDEVATIPGTTLTVFGKDYIGKTRESFLAAKDDFVPATILLWHAMIKEFAGPWGEFAPSIDDLPVDQYRLIALGDLHKREYKYAKNNPATLIGYPGSTELCKSDESLEKAFTVFTFSPEAHLLSEEKVVIPTRPVIRWSIRQDKDLSDFLVKVAEVKDKNPIVVGTYDADIPDVMSRLYTLVDAESAIIRFAPMPSKELPVLTSNEGEKTVADFVPEFLPPGPLSEVALGLLRPDAKVSDILNAYAESHGVAL